MSVSESGEREPDAVCMGKEDEVARQPLSHEQWPAVVPEVCGRHQRNEPPLAEEGVQPTLERRPKQEIGEHAVHEKSDC